MKRTKRAIAIGAAAVIVAATLGTTGAASAAGPKDAPPGYTEIPNSAYVPAAGEVATPADPADVVHFEAALQGRNTAGAQALAYAVSDPSSRLYGQFLSPRQYRALFAPTDSAANTVTSWLTGAGMQVTYNPSNHLMIAAVGTAATADVAFKTTMSRITYDDAGDYFLANTTNLSVPTNTLNVIDGFVEAPDKAASTSAPQHGGDGGDGRSTRKTGKVHTSTSAAADDVVPAAAPAAVSSAPPDTGFVNGTPCSKYWAQKVETNLPPTPGYQTPIPYAPCGYKPAQLQGAYGVTSLLQHGINGRGVTVAITDAYASPTIVDDINTYAARNGQASWGNKFNQVVPSTLRFGYDDPSYGGDYCGEQGWYGEETLDVEAVHTMAPGANVLYVGASSCFDQDLLGAVNDIVDQHQADIITNSWGGQGEGVDPTLLDVYNSVFLQAAIEGIGVFYSSGDSGDESDNTDDGSRTVDFPASDPWVTAVGGTSLAVSSSNSYLFETGWGTAKATLVPATKHPRTPSMWDQPLPGAHLYGGGGGTSSLFAEPAYQVGVVPNSIATEEPASRKNPGRAVPDIAALGDPSTGMLVGQTQTFSDGVRYGEYRIGGTSLASPLMAGIEALADQAAGHAHGFANPAIYRLRSSAVHDVVSPHKTVGVLRVDNLNGENPADGTVTTLRTFNQTQSIYTRPGYDDVTGVGSPIASVYATTLGRSH